jgi:hypothetical protein
LALTVGWVLGGTLQDRSMLWVWIVPSLGLCAAFFGICVTWAPSASFIAYPSVAPQTIAQLAQMGVSDRLENLFGWGDGVQPFNQVTVTLPFYSATAYSLGVLLARTAFRMPAYFKRLTNHQLKRLFLFVTVPWFCLKFVLRWQTVASKYPVLKTWTGLSVYLEGLIIVSVFVTFIFAIAVGLVGSQFFVTRFFLCNAGPHGDGATHRGLDETSSNQRI